MLETFSGQTNEKKNTNHINKNNNNNIKILTPVGLNRINELFRTFAKIIEQIFTHTHTRTQRHTATHPRNNRKTIKTAK